MSLRKILLEFNVTDSEKVLEDMMNKIGHSIEPLDYYIESGGYGDVFKIKGKDKVLKITTSSSEAFKVEDIVDIKFDHVINFYMVKKLPSGLLKNAPDQDLWIIIAEFLEDPKLEYNYIMSLTMRRLGRTIYYNDSLPDEPSDYRKDIIKYLKQRNVGVKTVQDAFNYLTTMENKLDDNSAKAFFLFALRNMKETDNGVIADFFKIVTDHIDLIPDVVKGLQELSQHYVMHEDLHLGNILIDPKTKNYKIIDIN